MKREVRQDFFFVHGGEKGNGRRSMIGRYIIRHNIKWE